MYSLPFLPFRDSGREEIVKTASGNAENQLRLKTISGRALWCDTFKVDLRSILMSCSLLEVCRIRPVEDNWEQFSGLLKARAYVMKVVLRSNGYQEIKYF